MASPTYIPNQVVSFDTQRSNCGCNGQGYCVPVLKDDNSKFQFKTNETVGDNLVTNGAFASDTEWTKGTGWTISGGKACHAAGTGSDLEQSIVTTGIKLFKVVFTVSGRTKGTVQAKFNSNGLVRSTNNTFTDYIFSNSGNVLLFTASSDFDGCIDNVTMFEMKTDYLIQVFDCNGNYVNSIEANTEIANNTNILTARVGTSTGWEEVFEPNLRNGNFSTDTEWIKEEGWSISGEAIFFADGGVNSGNKIKQSLVLAVGIKYKITYTVSIGGNYTMAVMFGDTVGVTQTSDGTYTEELICTGNTNLSFVGFGTSGNLTVDDVTIELSSDNDFQGVYNFCIQDEDGEGIIINFDNLFQDASYGSFSNIDGIGIYDPFNNLGTIELSTEQAFNGTTSLKYIDGLDGSNDFLTWSGYSFEDTKEYTMRAMIYVPTGAIRVNISPGILFERPTAINGALTIEVIWQGDTGTRDEWVEIYTTFTMTGDEFHEYFVKSQFLNEGEYFYVGDVVITEGDIAAARLVSDAKKAKCSNCFRIMPESIRTDCGYLSLIWLDTQNVFGFDYSGNFTQFLRVKGRLWKPSWNKLDKEKFRDSAGDRTTLYVNAEKREILTLAELPDFIHDAIAIAIEHERLLINSIDYYVEDDEYSPQWRKTSLLAEVEIEVIKDNQDFNKSNCG